MRSLILIATLFSVQAFACPNLSGNYTCTYGDGTTEPLSITQDTKSNVTTYNYNGSLIAADNNVYPVPDDETLKQGTFRAWCSNGNTLNAELLGQYYHEGLLYGDLIMNMEIFMIGNDLRQLTAGVLKNSSGEQPFNDSLSCVRN